MRLAEKRDDLADERASDGRARTASGDNGHAPAASLTADLILRGQRDGQQDEQHQDEQCQGAQRDVAPDPLPQSDPLPQPEPADEPSGPTGARAQQAVLEEAFAEPEPEPELEQAVVAPPAPVKPSSGRSKLAEMTPPLQRTEFEATRASAERWGLRGGPSAGFWDRFVKDVSIFTIFFAVLILAILQTM